MNRFGKVALGLLLAIAMSSCKMSDLRSESMKKEISAMGAEAKGLALMEQSRKAMGTDHWNQFETVVIEFTDEFHKLKLASPHPDAKSSFQLAYRIDNYDGRLHYQEGKKPGCEMGLSDWKTWVKKPGEAKHWKKNKKAWFWIPTYQYFILFPLKIQEANFIRYAGKKKLNGVEYDVVFASWNTDEPQKDIDQYLIYLHPENHRIELLQYTVRGFFKFIQGATFLLEYEESEGIQIPRAMKVLGPKVDFDKQDDVFHFMRIRGLQLDGIAPEELSGREAE